MKTPAPRLITTDAELVAWADRLAAAPLDEPIAVDTESDSLHRYREKVCLVQMTALGEDVIIDPLALSSLEPLAAVFADERRIKIFHDAGYDLICLHRDFGLQVRGLFDTMLASRLLGLTHFSLAALLHERFGHTADKRLQRSDWSRRPLTPEQLRYARYDTHFLPQLMQQLEGELDEAKRLDWAREEFARLPQVLARASSRSQGPSPDGFWRITGARKLTPPALGRLRALYLMREQLAERVDQPPFKVMGDFVLLELAETPPESLAQLRPRPGLRQAGITRFGREIIAALERAEPVMGGPPKGAGRRRRTGRMLDPEPRARYEALREARRELAQALGIEPEVVISNAPLEELAKAPPGSLEELEARKDIRGWRTENVALALWTALRAPITLRPPARTDAQPRPSASPHAAFAAPG